MKCRTCESEASDRRETLTALTPGRCMMRNNRYERANVNIRVVKDLFRPSLFETRLIVVFSFLISLFNYCIFMSEISAIC